MNTATLTAEPLFDVLIDNLVMRNGVTAEEVNAYIEKCQREGMSLARIDTRRHGAVERPAGRVMVPGGYLGTTEGSLASRPREIVVRLDRHPDVTPGVALYLPSSLVEVPTADTCPVHGEGCEAWA